MNSDQLKLNSYSTQQKMTESFLEIIKKLIIDKNSENVLPIIDSMKEKGDISYYLFLAILHDNIDVVKHIIEKNGFSIFLPLTVNPLSVYGDVNQNKEELNLVDIPLLILAAIGGSIEIFNYLLKKGADMKQIGHITLSPKKRNSVISNVLGAAAFYERSSLLEYLADNSLIKEANKKENGSTTSVLSYNFKSTEKKIKNNNIPFVKEYTGYTPVMLSIVNTKELSKVLITFKVLMNKVNTKIIDHEGNNLLHLASKSLNSSLVEFLIDELKMNPNETNSKNETPIILLNALSEEQKISEDFKKIKNILEKNDNVNYDNINDNLQSLIADQEKAKGKKNKNKKKDKGNELGLITNFEDNKIKTYEPEPKSKYHDLFDEDYSEEEEIVETVVNKQPVESYAQSTYATTTNNKKYKSNYNTSNYDNSNSNYNYDYDYNNYNSYDNYNTYDTYQYDKYGNRGGYNRRSRGGNNYYYNNQENSDRRNYNQNKNSKKIITKIVELTEASKEPLFVLSENQTSEVAEVKEIKETSKDQIDIYQVVNKEELFKESPSKVLQEPQKLIINEEVIPNEENANSNLPQQDTNEEDNNLIHSEPVDAAALGSKQFESLLVSS